jgi:hypothetical protein
MDLHLACSEANGVFQKFLEEIVELLNMAAMSATPPV